MDQRPNGGWGMVQIRGAQHFTWTLDEAVEALLASLRARGVVVGEVERAHLVMQHETQAVSLLVIHPIEAEPGGLN